MDWLNSSIVLDDGSLLVVGGGNTVTTAFDTSEIVAPGKESMPGPDLPTPYRFGCFIKYSPTKALLIGGSSGPNAPPATIFAFDTTWIFDIPSRTFTVGPSLNTVKTAIFWSHRFKKEDFCREEEIWLVELSRTRVMVKSTL